MAKKKTVDAAPVEPAPEAVVTETPRKSKKTKAADVDVDVCPRCNEPCHASDGTADGVHERCLTDEERARSNATEPAPEPPKKKSKKPKAATADMTLEDLAARYPQHLEDAGKSAGTTFSYRLELILALDELGKDTKLADLSPTKVLDYFASDRVTKTRTGVQKAKPTVDKTRRVLRLALVWAQDAGLVEKAPLPEDAATY